MPLEYIYARQHLESAGVVVASEFSCVSTLLSGALKVIIPLYQPPLAVHPFYAFHYLTNLRTTRH